jgi:2-keto-4-pentenoate hydratase/2-oxohepta-3-ene-1,7-dioic acid hydratase in catechol pathway
MKIARISWRGEVFLATARESERDFLVLSGARDMLSLLQSEDPPRETGASASFDEARILAPFSAAGRNIFCVGKNYREHAREFSRSGFEAGAVAGAEVDEYPAIFTKPRTAIAGPGDVIDLHANATQSVDYEAELAVVIGRGGINIRADDAFDHIYGYTIVNDVTARDRQQRHKQWFMGKALDGFCPMGPWVVTRDEVDAQALDVKCWVNDELRQSANTRDLIFSIPYLIETLSCEMALLPGDVISTGTPAGVGIGFRPPKFLKAGDLVRIAIEGVGALTNSFA